MSMVMAVLRCWCISKTKSLSFSTMAQNLSLQRKVTHLGGAIPPSGETETMRQPYHSQEKAVETIHVYVLREKDVAPTIADDTLGDQVPDTTSEKPHAL